MWAVVDGKEITDASPKSFTTTSLKPEIPKLKVASASQDAFTAAQLYQHHPPAARAGHSPGD